MGILFIVILGIRLFTFYFFWVKYFFLGIYLFLFHDLIPHSLAFVLQQSKILRTCLSEDIILYTSAEMRVGIQIGFQVKNNFFPQ